MSEPGTKWADLGPRIASAVVLAAIGVAAIWAGGLWFGALVAVAIGAIIWEITRMLAPDCDVLALLLGLAAGAILLASGFLPGLAVLVLLAVVPLAGMMMRADWARRWRFGIYAAYVMVAGFAIIGFRAELGLIVILWLVALVVATDVAGYFAGRIIGGPKFWPRVSPKKTWSGTAAGWIAAGLVGLCFAPWLGAGAVWLSVILSFASQMGDAAESALKRYTGIKDSSHLIPGHGGVWDRFDALLGATFLLFIARLAGLGG
jgi:phosphatidate cytidylyltransferase